MQADPNERIQPTTESSGVPMVPVAAGVVVLVALAAWLFTGREEPTPEVVPAPVVDTAPVVEEEETLPPTPDIPEPAPAPVEETPAPESAAPPEPALTLAESDEPVREALGTITRSELLLSASAAENLMERGVAVIDALSRGGVRHKLLPLTPPAGKFTVVKAGGQDIIDPASHRRYDAHAAAFADIDTAAAVAAFNRFRPLLEEAFGMLGYEPADFDNAVVAALDSVIAAPIITGPIEVRKVEAVYKYESPSLERLPALHRQLLRTGPDNTRIIQDKARELRAALLAQ